MPYRFATDKKDYSDYASGRVFYNAPGHPAFPVRLISEIFQRCIAFRQANGQAAPVGVYDPCCGAAYHLVALGYLHGEQITRLIGSDVDKEILAYARRNLSLLSESGLAKREEEIRNLSARYGKESHASALESVERFRNHLRERKLKTAIQTHLFQADATQAQEIAAHLPFHPVDLVLADIPYNQHTAWKLSNPSLSSPHSPIRQMLGALLPFVADQAIVAIASDKAQKIVHEAYQRIERFQVGKRQVVFLQPNG